MLWRHPSAFFLWHQAKRNYKLCPNKCATKDNSLPSANLNNSIEMWKINKTGDQISWKLKKFPNTNDTFNPISYKYSFDMNIYASCVDSYLRHMGTLFPYAVPCSVKPLSHSTAIPRRWHGDLKFLRAPWDRTKILKNIANNFTFFITGRCHGAPTATVAFPRSAHGVPPRSHGVLIGDWLRGHGALTACSWRAKSCHCASTACTQRARRAQCVSTASSRSVYEQMRKQVLQA